MTPQGMDPIRVLIADDHPIVREGLEVVLASEMDMELVAQATNGAEAVRLAQETQPDVIIMDLQMPVKDGLTAIRELDKAGLDAQILVLTSFPDDSKVFAAIKAGATGFLLKDSPPEHLLDAIRTVYRGESALHPAIASKLIARKRPRLYQIYDTEVSAVFGTKKAHLEPIRRAMRKRDRELHHRLCGLREKAALPEHISPLRVLDVLAWLEGKRLH